MSRVTLGAQYYPMWRRGGLCVHDNGGRLTTEVLDLTFNIWKFALWLTFWGVPPCLAWLIRWVPRGPQGRGYTIGWPARGAAE